MKTKITALLVCVFPALLFAQTALPPKKMPAVKKEIMSSIDARYADYRAAALRIWEYAEVGYKEYKSTVLLQDILKKAGFSVEAGVAEIPTAFVATYGSGKPVIGILAEFDALPGLSQQAVPEKNHNRVFRPVMPVVIICLE